MKLNEIHSSETMVVPNELKVLLARDRANWKTKAEWLNTIDDLGFPENIAHLATLHNVNMEQLFQYVENEME